MGLGIADLGPTMFLPFTAEKLGVESIITEQDTKWIRGLFSERNSFNFMLG
jgi:hypothetical protein